MKGIEVAYWLGARGGVPEVDEIIATASCSRSQAYRWRAFVERGGKSGRVAAKGHERRIHAGFLAWGRAP